MRKLTLFVPIEQTKLTVGTFEQWEIRERDHREELQGMVHEFPIEPGVQKGFFGPPGVDRSFKILEVKEVEIEAEKFKKIVVEYLATEASQPLLFF